MNDLEIRGLSHSMAAIVREYLEAESVKMRADFERFVEKRITELPAGPKGDPGESAQGPSGKDVDPEVTRALVARFVGEAVAALPPAKDGKDAPAVDTAAIAADVLRQIPTPQPGKDGKDAPPVDVDSIVLRAAELIPKPKDGKDADSEAMRELIAGVIDGLNESS